jgi:hypothetical protein
VRVRSFCGGYRRCRSYDSTQVRSSVKRVSRETPHPPPRSLYTAARPITPPGWIVSHQREAMVEARALAADWEKR